MSLDSQFDREERILSDQLDAGEISVEEYNAAMRDLEEDLESLRRNPNE